MTIEETWALLLSYGTKENAFNKQYDIYWRSTIYTPQKKWVKATFIWAFERSYGAPHGLGNERFKPVVGNKNIECCIRLNQLTAPSWFIWNNKMGYDSLVVIPSHGQNPIY